MRPVTASKKNRGFDPGVFLATIGAGRKRLTVVKKRGIFTQGIRLTLFSIFKKERFGSPSYLRSAKKLPSAFWATEIFLAKAR